MKRDLVIGVLLVMLGIGGIGTITMGLAETNWAEVAFGCSGIVLMVGGCALVISVLVFMIVAGEFIIEDSRKVRRIK